MKREEYKTRLIGKTFGNLYVKDFAGYKGKEILYLCECQCENKTEVYVTYNYLTSGKKDNCGCMTKIKQRQAKKKYNTYDLSGNYGIGYTRKGEEFYFDLEDYEKIKDYCWIKKYEKGKKDGYIYARSNNSKFVIMHRLVMDVDSDYLKVDHIFHILHDNRKSQLRIANNQQNCFNHVLAKNNTSGYSGVHYEKDTNKWRARIFINKKGIHLGRFDNIEDAIKARQEAELKYFGEFTYQEIAV